LQARWRGLDISLIDVQVQGDIASSQIVAAIEQFNAESDLADVLVLIRGGGSAEDLAAFSTEQVTRAVAASRIPTLVAIGHEIDLSLAEMASDQRASTPSNAAELLVPDRKDVVRELHSIRASLSYLGSQQISLARNQLAGQLDALSQVTEHLITQQKTSIDTYLQLLNALNPLSILRRGYGIIRHNGAIIKSNNLKAGDMIEAELASFVLSASVVKTNSRKRIHHA
jgi:exodeoxyribonuclease VII large subunit